MIRTHNTAHKIGLIFGILAALAVIPSESWALFGHGRSIQVAGSNLRGPHPTGIAPTSSTIIDTSPAGTPIATLVVSMSDGSGFVGSLSVTDGTGIVCSVSPCSVTTSLVSARQLTATDEGMHTLQISAAENGQTFTQTFTLNVYGLNLTVNPAAPSIPSTTALGGTVATLSASWSSGATFTGTEIFAAPNYDGGSVYSISASNLIVSTTGPGVSGSGGATQSVTLQAVQIPASSDGMVSNAPSGPPLANSTGVWFWDGAASQQSGETIVYASNAGSIVSGSFGYGDSMQVANGGQLYVHNTTQGWFVWNGTGFVASSGPTGCTCNTGNTAAICVSPTTAAANATLTISWSCGPSDTGSFVGLSNFIATAQAGAEPSGATNGVYGILTNGAASGSSTLPAPNAKVDRDEQWYASLQNSKGAQQAASNLFTVSASINPPVPTGVLPAALAADPFVPAHTMTVCNSGCNFTDLNGAVHNAHLNNWNNVKIVLSAADYNTSTFGVPVPSEYPQNLWIHGISTDGKTFAHIFGTPPTTSGIFSTVNATPGTGYTLTLDNLELGYWNSWKILIPGDSTTWTLRNVYVHDGLDGLESGNNWPATYNIYNSVFARNGGGSGPDHNVYIGNGGIVDGNGNPTGNGGNTINVINSAFEQPNTGHSFKERAANTTYTCSILAANADTVYLGTGDYDADFGNLTFNKSLLFQGNGGGNNWNNLNGPYHGKFSGDNETGRFLSPLLYNEVVTGSNLVNDHNVSFWPMAISARFTGPNPVPAPWTGSKFVWSNASSRHTSGDGGFTSLNGVVTQLSVANVTDVSFDGTDNYYTSWSAAGFSLTPNAEPYGWRDLLPLVPSACTDPIGLVKIPAS